MIGRTRCSLLVLLASLSCGHEPLGRLQYETLSSRSEGRDMRYGVYLPPGWDRKTPLPLVLLLHGAGDDETSADRTSVVGALDRAIAAKQLPPFVMVMPDGDRGFWVNWYDGSHRYRDWVVEEVLPDVRARYPTLPDAAGLHLVGVSMGGGGGMQMWLADPGRFASATIVSAPILDEAQTRKFLRRFMPNKGVERVFGPEGKSTGVDPYVALRQPAALRGSRLLFGAAKGDLGGIRASNERFHDHLEQNSVPHEFVTFAGNHSWDAWGPMFVYSLCHQLDPACTMALPKGWSRDAVP